MKVLLQTGIQFDPDATMNQLRPLYDEYISEVTKASEKEENANALEDPDAAADKNTQTSIPATIVQSIQPVVTSVPTFIATTSVQNSNVLTDVTTTAAYVSAKLSTADTRALVTTPAMSVVVSSGPSATATTSAQLSTAVTTVQMNTVVPSATISNNLDEDETERLLIQLRKKRELLMLQAEINQLTLQQQAPAAKTRWTDVSVIESMMSKFTADDHYDVNKWISDLDDAFAMLQFDERMKFIACRRMLSGTAQVFARTITVSDYEELKAKLISEFGRMRTMNEVYQLLKNRRLRPDETTHRYILDMQEIAMYSKITEDELIEMIISGTGDTSSRIGHLFPARSINELKEFAERYERLRFQPPLGSKQIAIINRNAASALQPTTHRSNAANATSVRPTAAPTMETIRCYNCSKFGHYQSQCPLPKRPANSCFKCSSTEHVYRECPHRTTVAAVLNANGMNDARVEPISEMQMPPQFNQTE
ncbi:uncharacterized protein LOC125778858 [Bactrocera dorsalis]|nr:uncharacterized protein LOC125778858 [Bactrocera dorsalis]